MKRLSKLISLLFVLLLFSVLTLSVGAVSATQNTSELEVKLVSEPFISGTPLKETDLSYTVTNNTSKVIETVVCYLSLVDIKDNTIYDDEFGESARQPVILNNLEAGETTAITVPLQIIFAGSFRITASALDLTTGATAISKAVCVEMSRPSTMNNTLVIITAVMTSVVQIGIVAFLMLHKKFQKIKRSECSK